MEKYPLSLLFLSLFMSFFCLFVCYLLVLFFSIQIEIKMKKRLENLSWIPFLNGLKENELWRFSKRGS
jgi:hypothetical protein